jgi:hypothetical protein
MGSSTTGNARLVATCLIACSDLIGLRSLIAQEPSPKSAPTALYSDQEIRKLAKHDIDKVGNPDRGLLGIPCLDVVPNGESYPRARVFAALKIEDHRVRDFRESGVNNVVFLTWQVSPSYDISCMTATNDPQNDGLEMTDPRRKVYGIRLVKRSK